MIFHLFRLRAAGGKTNQVKVGLACLPIGLIMEGLTLLVDENGLASWNYKRL